MISFRDTITVQTKVSLIFKWHLFVYLGGNLMTEKKEKTNVPKTETEELKDSKKKELQIDWAEEASHELQDYIEEQGIYIRY